MGVVERRADGGLVCVRGSGRVVVRAIQERGRVHVGGHVRRGALRRQICVVEDEQSIVDWGRVWLRMFERSALRQSLAILMTL